MNKKGKEGQNLGNANLDATNLSSSLEKAATVSSHYKFVTHVYCLYRLPNSLIVQTVPRKHLNLLLKRRRLVSSRWRKTRSNLKFRDHRFRRRREGKQYNMKLKWERGEQSTRCS